MVNAGWEESLIINIRKNINWLLEKNYNKNQTMMAKELGIKTNTLHMYINSSTKPPITFICRLCSKNNISMDSFVSEDLSLTSEKNRRKESVKQIYSKYKGLYYAYFLVVDSNSLKEGLVQEGLLKVSESGVISFEIINTDKEFTGSLMASEELIFFDLKNSREKICITIKNPGKNIKEKYIGGMGITNVSSPEDNRIPSAQKIIISSIRIPVDKYFDTLRDFLVVNPYFKVRKRFLEEILSEKIKISRDKYLELRDLIEDNRVSSEEKIVINEKRLTLLQEILDKEEFLKLKEIIKDPKYKRETSWLWSIKVNLEEDKMIYRFIKNEFCSDT